MLGPQNSYNIVQTEQSLERLHTDITEYYSKKHEQF